MKILVTGGGGFIASHIVDAYLEEGYKVLVVDDLSTGNKKNINKNAYFEKVSILNKDALEGIFLSFKPDIVNHHAAQVNLRYSFEDPVFDAEINIIGGINLLQLSLKYGVKKFIFASSGGAIYGESEKRPINEDYAPHPFSPYGVSKLSLEEYIRVFSTLNSMKYTILRYANVYGPRQDPLGEAGVISIFINNIINNKPCIVFGDGEQTRDYVYIKDVVSFNLQVLDSATGIYNVGTGIEYSINDLIKYLKKITGENFKVIYGEPIPGEIRYISLDSSKAKEELNWEPQFTFKEGLEETYRFFLNKDLK